MAGRLHIMHVVISLDVGGLERVVLSLVREGVRAGHCVSVLCLERPGKLAPDVRELGAEVVCVDKAAGVRLGTIGKIAEVLRQMRPEVVHCHQIGALFYAGPAARRAGVPVIVHTEHGKHFETRRRNRWLGWWAAKSAQRMFCVSGDIARAMKARGVADGEKVLVLHNGIDTQACRRGGDGAALRRTLGIPLSAAVMGTVGRLADVKRQDVLLRGFARLKSGRGGELPHAVLVGAGPREADLRKLAGELGVEGRVHFAGHSQTPERFLEIMDVFALTSASEGMPLVVLEAWAAGVPVVASRVGGLPEMIEEGRTGLLFDSLDDAGLARRVEELLGDGEVLRRIAETAQRHVMEHFDVSVMAENYERHYRELLGPAPGGGERQEVAAAAQGFARAVSADHREAQPCRE